MVAGDAMTPRIAPATDAQSQHAHLAVDRSSAAEVLVGLHAIAGAPVERVQAEVTVGNEELSGKREHVTVATLGVLRRISTGDDAVPRCVLSAVQGG